MSEEILAASRERVASLLEPVNGGVGEDVSYDEKFDEIKTETDKLSSVTGEPCNWGSVASLAHELLTEKSKDFRLVCYWGAAKIQDQTAEALLDALVLVTEFTKQYWDECFPPLRRMRARAGILGWLSDRADGAKDAKLTAKDQPMVTAIDELSKAVDAEFREKFGDDYPGISEIREAARHFLRTCPKEKPKPEPKPEPDKPAEGAAAPAAAPRPAPAAMGEGPAVNPGALTDPGQAQQALGSVGQLLTKMGDLLRTGKPEDPLAYRLKRTGMWLQLTEAPPVTDGKTLVPPPSEGLRTRFDALVASNDWLTLLNEADVAAGQSILWLDPHRYVATAMDQLGALFLKAKEALLVEVALVLKRLPTFPDLAFNTGVPFADGQTKMWIEAEVIPVLGSGEGGGGGAAEPSVLDEPLEEARDLAVKGKLPEAIGVVAEAAARAPTPVERFRGKLALGQLCLQAGQFDVARAQLDALVEVVQRHDLAAWDPRLCAELYGSQYSAYKGLVAAATPPAGPGGMPVAPAAPGAAPAGPPPELLTALDQAFGRLCELDPAAALKLGGDGK